MSVAKRVLSSTLITAANACKALWAKSKLKALPIVKFLVFQLAGFALLLWVGSILCSIAYEFDPSSADSLYLGIVLAAVVLFNACCTFQQGNKLQTAMECELEHFIHVVSGIAIFIGLTFCTVGMTTMDGDFAQAITFMIRIMGANVSEGLLPIVIVSLALRATELFAATITKYDDQEEDAKTTKFCTLWICGGMEGMEAALLDDLERVQTERTGNIRVVLRTDSGETEAFVSPLDTVADAVSSALCTGLSNIESILLDGQDVSDSTFEEFGIENGARLTVIIRRTIRTKAQVETLVDEIAACNPGANRARMLGGAKFDADENLHNWNLSDNKLESLPDSFGSLKVGGHL